MRSVGVGDVARHDAPGYPEHADIAGVAETDDDIRNEVCRHDEIRECGYESVLHTDRRFRILGAAISSDGFPWEGKTAPDALRSLCQNPRATMLPSATIRAEPKPGSYLWFK